MLFEAELQYIIKCLEKHFTRHGIPETLRTDNGSNLVSHEMEEFLDELGIKHKRTIPLLLRANGEVERHSSGIPLLVMLLPNVNLHKVT